ncbi:DUF1489 family protein [Rhizobiaceae bacterium BDR2-2]|uniref:DUF1489 family protein n=1 Tax=Ectorhizobium quercum TaxID=2965071 RepID=A0AAE3MZ52_9HYPH|nr:DUF1489 family protein [Ectorhizobium quercum]MCX8997738.1 DUF1489 family protein [Ectorhizobium quercum]
MSLHMIKLCVGAESVADLKEWVAERALTAMAAGQEPHSRHRTRMMPKRVPEILDGGSLYWVIKGQVAARQQILGLEAVKSADGISYCDIVLAPAVIETAPQPKRPFQGWRYYRPEDVPRDLGSQSGEADMPEDLRRELAELGLL